MPFLLLLAVAEINVNLASKAFFVHHNAPRPQLKFRKLIAKDLINNGCLTQETSTQDICKSKRKRASTAHCLLPLPPYTTFIGNKTKKAKACILKLHALLDIKKCACTVYVLQEYFGVVSALQSTVWRLTTMVKCRTAISLNVMVNQGLSEKHCIYINSTIV